MSTLNHLTAEMNRLETVISRQQNYILKFGEANDKDSDTAWESYKADAEYNLRKWDTMKAKRDELTLQNGSR